MYCLASTCHFHIAEAGPALLGDRRCLDHLTPRLENAKEEKDTPESFRGKNQGNFPSFGAAFRVSVQLVEFRGIFSSFEVRFRVSCQHFEFWGNISVLLFSVVALR